MPASGSVLSNVLETKGIKFNVKTNGVKYEAVMYKDRPTYERIKTQRTNSDLSTASESSASSSGSKGTQ